ncbi:HEXXH motif domain-containing protein [Nonomuraea sp. NPDC050790]|uniref:HEXXH motif domain-containing protein n=1 Tax=Nonomuraea sp. NPDC050790 TaxID=3364371 RepID=UPI00379F0BDD
MRLRPHRLPDDVMARLAAGGGGAEAARHLAVAERSKHRLLVLGVVQMAVNAGHVHSTATDRAFDLLAEIEKKRPEAVRDTLDYPAVGAWAGHTVVALPSGESCSPAQLGAVAAVAAIKAGLPCTTKVPVLDGVITLPSLGQLVLPTGSVAGDLIDLRVRGDGVVEAAGVRVRVGTEEHPGWRPLRRLATADASLTLMVDDLDPFRWTSETVIEGRLSVTELGQWRSCLDAAWRMLREHHWSIADEILAIVPVLTPIQRPRQGMNSASAADRFGAIALSTPLDGRWLASTFAHEIQHVKLGATMDVVRLVEPDDSRYYAPWRPDPRPLSGLLQGAYAYLGVAGFWRRQRAHETDLRPHIEFAHWRESTFAVTSTLLDSGRLSPEGERFVCGMRRTLSAWQDEPAPPAALDAARQEAQAHLEEWLARNG